MHHVIGSDGRADVAVVPPVAAPSTNPYDVVMTKKTVAEALDVVRPLIIEKANVEGSSKNAKITHHSAKAHGAYSFTPASVSA